MKLSPMPLVVTGSDALCHLERIVEEGDWHRLFVVTGPHVSKTSAFCVVQDVLASKGREVVVWDRVTPDPSLELVCEASREAKKCQAEVVVGMGGGSPLDCAKIVSASLGNSQEVKTFLGVDKVPRPGAPLIAIPTTSGTGSEVTNISILTDVVAQMKVAVVSDHLVPKVALLMPEMTMGMPLSVTAATGMDAFCHAAESYLSSRRNSYSDALALKALRLIGTHLVRAYRNPEDGAAREGMQWAALLAGLSFTNSSVTAVHAFSYPLGGVFHVPHGMANSLMVESVFRHNASFAGDRMADLAEALVGVRDPGALLRGIRKLRMDLSLPLSLREVGIPESAIPDMAKNVLGVTRLLSVNPAPILLGDAIRIFQEAYDGY